MINYMIVPGIPNQSDFIDCKAAKIWEIEPSDLKVKTRRREVVEARMACMVYRRMNLNMTFSESGKRYNKDHATVIHAIKTVENLREYDKSFLEKHDEFLRQLV